MLFKLITNTLFSLFVSTQLLGMVNLEDSVQDFVLKTKQIIIPAHPHAFNPSIIRWDNKILLSFRIMVENSNQTFAINSSSESLIGLQWLDKDFNLLGEPQVLNFGDDHYALRSEDARLIKVSDKCYIVYSDNRNYSVSDSGFRMHITELKIDGNAISIVHTHPILSFEGERQTRREKNWVPFDYQGNLLLAYSLLPHKILHPIPYTDFADSISNTRCDITWEYGELRGGTPAILDEDEYLAFFHSSKEMKTIHSNNEEISHYFMGAYTFNQHPPFEITKISEKPIIAEGFYEGKKYLPYWKPVRVVFPCGLIVDKHFIYISYGRQDHEIWILKMDKKKLKKSLVSVDYNL